MWWQRSKSEPGRMAQFLGVAPTSTRKDIEDLETLYTFENLEKPVQVLRLLVNCLQQNPGFSCGYAPILD